MAIQKFPLLKSDLLLTCADNRVIILNYKCEICVSLFITFDLISTRLCFEIFENRPIFKFQIQILQRAHLGLLGSFNMLFRVLRANYVENQLVGNFFLSQP